MGRARQPTDLIVAKGKKHLTKSELASRKSQEVHVSADAVMPPDYLDKKQREKFEKIAQDLQEIGIIGNLDCDCLGRYLVAETAYLKLTRHLKRMSLDNLPAYERAVNLQDKYFKQCRSLANDLGLSITSRCRLVVPKSAPEKPPNKFERFNTETG